MFNCHLLYRPFSAFTVTFVNFQWSEIIHFICCTAIFPWFCERMNSWSCLLCHSRVSLLALTFRITLDYFFFHITTCQHKTQHSLQEINIIQTLQYLTPISTPCPPHNQKFLDTWRRKKEGNNRHWVISRYPKLPTVLTNNTIISRVATNILTYQKPWTLLL